MCQYVDINIKNAAIFEIEEICVFSDSDTPCIVLKLIQINTYMKPFASFEIGLHSSLTNNSYKILSISSIAGPPINTHITARGLQLIRPKPYC